MGNKKWVDIGAPKNQTGNINHAGDRRVEQKEVSKMRTTCKSHTDDKGQKASAVKRKRAANTGPKPTNVKTF